MASLYSNENIPNGLVAELRALGHDVLTSYEAGNANQRVPDDAVLRFATDRERSVLTLNRQHFKRLHRATRGEHAGIVSCTPESDHVAHARRIHEILCNVPTLSGRHVRIYRGHHEVD